MSPILDHYSELMILGFGLGKVKLGSVNEILRKSAGFYKPIFVSNIFRPGQTVQSTGLGDGQTAF